MRYVPERCSQFPPTRGAGHSAATLPPCRKAPTMRAHAATTHLNLPQTPAPRLAPPAVCTARCPTRRPLPLAAAPRGFGARPAETAGEAGWGECGWRGGRGTAQQNCPRRGRGVCLGFGPHPLDGRRPPRQKQRNPQPTTPSCRPHPTWAPRACAPPGMPPPWLTWGTACGRRGLGGAGGPTACRLAAGGRSPPTPCPNTPPTPPSLPSSTPGATSSTPPLA